MDDQNKNTVPSAAAKSNKKKESGGLIHTVFDYVEMFVFTIVAVILVLTFGIRICEVGGDSMDRTLANKERLLVSDLFYTPGHGDIIVFHETDDRYGGFNEPIVKRVIATGGEYVRIDYTAGKVYVSSDAVFTEDDLINESDYIWLASRNADGSYTETGRWAMAGAPAQEWEVPEGYLFVMGDNRNVSADSRSDRAGMGVGFVEEERVLGKVLLRITPFNKFGTVE